jgi:hypothetical protein
MQQVLWHRPSSTDQVLHANGQLCVWMTLAAGGPSTSKKSVAASDHSRSCMCILPPHSRMMAMMRGCGMADLMASARMYSSFRFFVFFCSVYI